MKEKKENKPYIWVAMKSGKKRTSYPVVTGTPEGREPKVVTLSEPEKLGEQAVLLLTTPTPTAVST